MEVRNSGSSSNARISGVRSAGDTCFTCSDFSDESSKCSSRINSAGDDDANSGFSSLLVIGVSTLRVWCRGERESGDEHDAAEVDEERGDEEGAPVDASAAGSDKGSVAELPDFETAAIGNEVDLKTPGAVGEVGVGLVSDNAIGISGGLEDIDGDEVDDCTDEH